MRNPCQLPLESRLSKSCGCLEKENYGLTKEDYAVRHVLGAILLRVCMLIALFPPVSKAVMGGRPGSFGIFDKYSLLMSIPLATLYAYSQVFRFLL